MSNLPKCCLPQGANMMATCLIMILLRKAFETNLVRSGGRAGENPGNEVVLKRAKNDSL